MGMASELTLQAVESIAEEVGIDNTSDLTAFLYLRARGFNKSTEKEDENGIDEILDVSRNTLTNWENQIEKKLSESVQSELVMNAMAYEHQIRYLKEDQEG